MVHQHFTLAENLTVLDNIVLGTESLWQFSSNSQKSRARIGQLAQEFGLEVSPDAIVTSLSVGERQRVEILKALYREAKILVLDEPTAVLTPQVHALFETLKRFVAGPSIFHFQSLAKSRGLQPFSVLRGGRLVAERGVEGSRDPNLPNDDWPQHSAGQGRGSKGWGRCPGLAWNSCPAQFPGP
jgi:simple sugar transport system ATP-binding protein